MAQVAAPAVRIVNQVDESQLVTLKGTVHRLANAANDRGVAPESMQLERMHLVLKRSDSQETALEQLIGEMHTPGSASYHKWLTPDEFGKQFGPSDEDIATVQTWLTGHGFNVTKVNPGKQTIEFSGNVAQLRTAFHTQIHKYQVNGETHYANASDPKIPAALAPVVAGFVSLNNFRMKSYVQKLGKATYDPKTDKATPQWTMSGGNYVLSPADYAVQYDLSPLYTAGTTGAGQTIAIVNESNINIELVNQFRSLFGFSPNPPQVIIDGNDPGVDGINNPDGPNYASVEAYLDVEWAGAVAPNANVDLVIAADTALENGLFLASERAVYSNVAPIISLSFGNCESDLGTANQFLNSLWEQAAAQGITVLVSTGDSGSAGCDDDNSQYYAVSGQAVSGFASTPYNVAVGGTDFYYSDYATGGASISNYWNTTASNSTPSVSIKGVIPEQPWNDSQYGLNIYSEYALSGNTATSIAAGSGGASNCAFGTYNASTGATVSCSGGYAKPSWQTGLGDSARDIPDVSLFASSGVNGSYYPICANDGDCQPASSGQTVQIYGVGGTSASTPSFAGIMALVNQKYGRQGQANTVLYQLAAQFPASFHDVTHGTNSVPCETGSTNCIAVSNPLTVTDPTYGTAKEGQIGTGTTAEYNAGVGYDMASGLGTVDAYQMVTNWGSIKLASTSTTMTPSSTTFAHGTAITINGAVSAGSGTPSGQVALMTDSTEPVQQGQGLPALLNGSQSTFTLSNGSYTGSVSTLPGGSYNIWGQYGGDASNGLSTSTKTPITVTPEASGIYFNVISSLNGTATAGKAVSGSVDYGTQMLLSGQVAPSSQLSSFETCTTSCPVFTIPTGTITFTDGSTALNTAVINAEGDAEYNAPFTVGSHSVTASYSGDKSYNASTASAITFTVVKDTPNVFVGASNQTSSTQVFQVIGGSGQPTVFTVGLENNAQNSASSNSPVSVAPPTGSVGVTGFPSGVPTSATLSAGVDPSNGYAQMGVATFTLPASTPTGNYNITITYAGDANYTATTPVSGTVQVVSSGGLASTTTATMSGSISPTSTITVTGTVTGQSGHPAPTGFMDFFSSGGDLGGVTLVPGTGITSTFSATLSSQVLFQGANIITVQYYGDTVYNPSAFTLNSGSPISNPLSDFTLVPQTTIVPVTAGSNGTDTINIGSVNSFSGTVNLTCSTDVGVTCTVSPTAGLSSGGSATATLTINAGTYAADQSYNVLVTGTDAATGKYIHTLNIQAVVTGSVAGSKSFALSNGGSITMDAGINTNNTSTITVTPVGGFTGAVALACVVTPPTGANNPATCAVSPPSVTISGATAQATLTVTTAPSTSAGVYTVTVTGTSGSIKPTTVVTVNIGTPSFTVANSGNITLSRGATTGNTATITLTPTNGFTGAISLSCVVTPPSGANDPVTCSVPASVTISGTTAQTATLTISSTAATALNQPMKLFWPSTGGAVLALAFFFGIPKRRSWLAMVGLLVLFVSVAGIGCGGGSGTSSGGGTSSNPGTTSGTYTVAVTATSGSIQQTTNVTVTVQ
jgi:hypothetical protein